MKASHFVDRTYINHFVVMHLHGSTSLGAFVQDYPAHGGVTYANVSGTAKFYYRPKGGKTWRYLGSSKTTSAGVIGSQASGTLSGTFKIVFPAQGNFFGSTAEQSLS